MTDQINRLLKKPGNQNYDSKTGFNSNKLFSPAVLILLIIILGIALRIYDLGTESYWIDEMSSLLEGQQSIHQLLTSGRFDQPPSYYLPFHYWIQLFGPTEASTRAFSVLFGSGVIFLVYMIGRELFGNEVGLLSAFLTATSGFQIIYSQMTRFYIFFEFMVLLSFLFYILALRSNRISYFGWYLLASVLMLYSHIFGVFILMAQNFFLILQRKNFEDRLTIWFICQILISLAFVPYVFPLISGDNSFSGAAKLNSGRLSVPSMMDLLHAFYYYFFIGRGKRSWGNIITNYSAAGILLVAGTWFFAIRQGKNNWIAAVRAWASNLQVVPDFSAKLLLVSLWFMFPLMIPFIFSHIFFPIFSERYTISAAPALYMLLALTIYNSRKIVPLIVSLSVLVIMMIPGLNYYYSQDINEQWQETAETVEKNSTPNDVIVFAPLDDIVGVQQKSFDWYYQGNLPSCGLHWALSDSEVKDILSPCVKGHDRFWVIIRGTNEDAPHNRFTSFFQEPDQTGSNLLQEHQFVGVSVYLFEVKK